MARHLWRVTTTALHNGCSTAQTLLLLLLQVLLLLLLQVLLLLLLLLPAPHTTTGVSW
jgi:hypothetical protein